MSDAIDKIKLPDGYGVKQYKGTTMPERTDRFSMKWDGEWHITVEVFRDLGLAFAAVLVLIYVLVVGWFRSFVTPLVIMAPIPLTLVGILPAHAMMGAFFTATSDRTMPERTDRFSMKWDGEWHITVEVFRDLGLAFAAVLVLIYVLVVGWFRSFVTPLVIMAPIPLTLVGILPAHAMMGAFFTAT